MHYKKIIWQWKHKLKDAQLLWQGNLPNRASKIKRLLARHDIHLPRASGQVLSYTSVIRVNAATSQPVRVKEATPPPLDVCHFEYYQGGECLPNAH
jgi:hypothetical protein